MMLGSVNIAPPGILVSMASQPSIKPDPSGAYIKITFSVDEDDYKLLESPPFEVMYTVRDGALAGEYQHASGSLAIQSVEPEGDILKVSGKASGTLARTGRNKDAGPELDYEANFVVRAHRH